MSHKILKRFRIHPAFCHVAAVGMPANVWSNVWHLNPVNIIVAAYHTVESVFPVHGYQRHSFFVSEKESNMKDLKGPFDDTHYMAIGGVNPQNIRQFFDAGYLSVGLASSLMPKDAVAANDWETCEAYVRDLVSRIGRN